MPTPTTAIVVAVVAAIASVLAALGSLTGTLLVERSRRRSAAALEQLKDDLVSERDAASKAAQVEELMATYSKPLARSAYDLQSRIFNVYRSGRWDVNPEYYRLNTLFLLAEFLGWLEIVRREIQFLDTDVVETTRDIQRRVDVVRDTLAATSRKRGLTDGLYVLRGEQRAIGELMLVENRAGTGPAEQCRGYASFVTALDQPEFARWFDRLGRELDALVQHRPPRLIEVQHALIDLIDLLDPDRLRFPDHRDKADPAWASQ